MFRMSDYRRFLKDNADSIGDFKQRQQAAFEAERERWRQAGIAETPQEAGGSDDSARAAAEAFDGEVIVSQVSGGIWSVLVQAGAEVKAGQPLVVVESMKMEITVHAGSDGLVHEILCAEGQAVSAGQPLVLVR